MLGENRLRATHAAFPCFAFFRFCYRRHFYSTALNRLRISCPAFTLFARTLSCLHCLLDQFPALPFYLLTAAGLRIHLFVNLTFTSPEPHFHLYVNCDVIILFVLGKQIKNFIRESILYLQSPFSSSPAEQIIRIQLSFKKQ